MRRRAVRILVSALALTTGCRGPDPLVLQRTARPVAGGEALRVEAQVENRGSGSGQVAVEVVVRVRAAGAVVARASKDVDFGPRETQTVVVDVPLPAQPAVDVRHLDVQVDARYPID